MLITKIKPLSLQTFLKLLVFIFLASFSFSFTAIADTKKLELTLIPKQNNGFASLVSEAEALANKSILQNFKNGATEIVIYILGDRNGQRVPILSISVTKVAWQNNPNIKSWVKYFSGAEILLGYSSSVLVASKSNTIPNTSIAPIAEPQAINQNLSPNRVNQKNIYPSENESNFYK